MKKIIIVLMLIFTLSGCTELHLSTFFNTLSDRNRSYLLIVTVNSESRSGIYVDCDNAYAFSYIDDEKVNEIYFTNIHDDYKTYTKKDDSWKLESNDTYYQNYFGIKQLRKLSYTFDGTSYISEYANASFEINLFKSNVTITNTDTNEYVVYSYDFSIQPTVSLPFNVKYI